ncbi:MAG: VanZ family protein [Muribaculaceae bacterium]|nr:VanZ family protein [Muribaculaceae bacterium]
MRKVELTEKFRTVMGKLPAWIFTILCLAACLYLTLMPDPLPENDIPLFPGADKVAHGLMFFGLSLCGIFDTLRYRRWRPVPLSAIALVCLLSMGVGVGIEFLQRLMAMGRGFEVADMVADGFGAILAGALWILICGFAPIMRRERLTVEQEARTMRRAHQEEERARRMRGTSDLHP